MKRAAASLLVVGLVLPLGSPVATADTVSVPHTFLNETPANRGQINANFDAVAAAVNDDEARIRGAWNTENSAALFATAAQAIAENAEGGSWLGSG